MTTPSRVLAPLARFPAVVALTAALILLSAMTPGGSSAYLLLADAAIAAVAVVMTSTGPATWTVRGVLARATGTAGHGDAPTAYWCAVPVPHRPQRPRAPGRR